MVWTGGQRWKVRPLYVVSAVLGISGALWTASSRGAQSAPQPEDRALSAKMGFKTFEEEQMVGSLIDKRRIEGLSKDHAALLHEVVRRRDASRLWAIGAISNLVGYDLQSQYLEDMRPIFKSEGENPVVKAVLPSWLQRNGLKTLQLLAADPDPTISAAAKSALKGPSIAPEGKGKS